MTGDEFDYQGRSKKRYESNMKIGCLIATVFWGSVIISFLYNIFK